MNIEKTILPGVIIINTDIYQDNRGFFVENYHKEKYDTFKIPGLNLNFVQDNHSFSKKNVLRGLHFQLERPQGKLVSVIDGEVFDVVADVNPNSKTLEYKGKTVYFWSSSAQRRWKRDPEKYFKDAMSKGHLPQFK